MNHEISRLRDFFRTNGQELTTRWFTQLAQRDWLVDKKTDRAADLQLFCQRILDHLENGVRMLADEKIEILNPSRAELREAFQVLSFATGWMAGVKFPMGAVVALCETLDQVLGGTNKQFREALLIGACEAYVVGLRDTFHQRHRSVIEKSQVVTLVGERLPALFLVGDPEQEAVEQSLGRLITLSFMRGAEAAIVDLSGVQQMESVLRTLLKLVAVFQGKPVNVFHVVGVPEQTRLPHHFGPSTLIQHSDLLSAIKAASV